MASLSQPILKLDENFEVIAYGMIQSHKGLSGPRSLTGLALKESVE